MVFKILQKPTLCKILQKPTLCKNCESPFVVDYAYKQKSNVAIKYLRKKGEFCGNPLASF